MHDVAAIFPATVLATEVSHLPILVSQHASECSIELIPFPSTVFSEAREDFRSEAVIRIRILHCRGIDQPAGPAEQHALEEVEKHIQGLGVRRR